MAQPITLTTEGLMLNWLKDVGDSVKAGEIIAEIEADKATVEIEAPGDGVLLEISAEIGEELAEGDVIGTIGASGEAPASGGDSAPAAASAETEAAPVEAAAPSTASQNGGAATTDTGRLKVSPVARNMAEERGIDLNRVTGSGPGGRILKSDVEGFDPASAPAPAAPKAAPAASASPAAPAASAAARSVGATYGKIPAEDVEVEDMSRMRRAIADGTIRSFTNTPHFYVNREVQMDAILALRKEVNAGLEADGIKVSVNDMLVKAIALALRKFPNLNSHYYGDQIVRHQRINVGIAVALPDNGLVNVVAHDADKRSLSDLAVENRAMFDRAREGKIKPDDIKHATFSISNLGPYNVDWFSAIISAPEAGMLAVGAAKKKPVVLDDGSIGVASMMGATLSIDHRVSDGAEGAQFMEEFSALVENPMRLLV